MFKFESIMGTLIKKSCIYSTTINITETIVSIIMQDGITHTSNVDKGSVYFDWTAPAAGSGALSFGYTMYYNTMSYYRQAGRQAVSTKGYTISLSSASKFRR